MQKIKLYYHNSYSIRVTNIAATLLITSLLFMPTTTAAQQPTFSKSFADTSIMIGEITTLGFSIDNSTNATAADDLEFTDELPVGLTFAAPLNLNSNCGAIISTIVGNTATLEVTAGSIEAGASCAISIDIEAIALGIQNNITSDLTSTLGNSVQHWLLLQ